MPTSFLADRPDQLMTTLHAVQSTGMKSNSKGAIVETSFDLLLKASGGRSRVPWQRSISPVRSI